MTWLSHMLDCELYGIRPAGHHLTNVFLHIVNTLLLFLILKRMTGTLWQSAFVAALFAVHPLHVESVAWVSERKDVLSTFFWFLTMLAYVRYVQCPGFSRYLLVVLSFALGLMAKPMLVTLPFLLLLMDYWPIGRFQFGRSDDHGSTTPRRSVNANRRSQTFRLVWEKAPLLALSAVSSIVTFLVQQSEGALAPIASFPLKVRIANALVSYGAYIGKMVWHGHLAVPYAHPGMVPVWKFAGAGLLLLSISGLVIRLARQHPYLATGWLWYLGTLVPVIGLVQVGAQAMADRYTYIPLIGLFIMVGWGVPRLLKRWPYRRIMLLVTAGLLLLTLMVCTRIQVGYWRNSVTLFEHAIRVTADNYLAHVTLGIALYQEGRLDEAVVHFSEALRINSMQSLTTVSAPLS